ncbi:MAG: DUF302 domain-containing protein [Pseudorhodoplanes sp.]|uniref:DUF302 domain-containing protein n=1 Tax=Pseudorhodoplanes sp. TaxID=1934341 RepID=UPI003D0A58F0
MNRFAFAAIALLFMSATGNAGTVAPHPGWSVIDTKLSFSALVERLDAAVKAEKMGLVTAASASDAAKAAGFTIPGNRVVGVYRNDFARRMLAASVPAGIEAPIRFYVTENPDGTATLSYKTPSTVFAPYLDQGKDALKSLASELDAIFARIAVAATK